MSQAKPGLQRSRDHRIILGVCGGFADWLGWSPAMVRVAFFLVSICSSGFPGILVYLLLALLMPLRRS